MKVFLAKTLYFTRFPARALTVFFGEKKFAEARNAETLGFCRTNQRADFAAV
jgi:hypothetical protein